MRIPKLPKIGQVSRIYIYPWVIQYNQWLKDFQESAIRGLKSEESSYTEPLYHGRRPINFDQVYPIPYPHHQINNGLKPKPIPLPTKASQSILVHITPISTSRNVKNTHVKYLGYQATFIGKWNRANAAAIFGTWTSWPCYKALIESHLVIATVRVGENSAPHTILQQEVDPKDHISFIDLLINTFGLHIIESKEEEEEHGGPILETHTLDSIGPLFHRKTIPFKYSHPLQYPKASIPRRGVWKRFPTSTQRITVEFRVFSKSLIERPTQLKTLFNLIRSAQELQPIEKKLNKNITLTPQELNKTLQKISVWQDNSRKLHFNQLAKSSEYPIVYDVLNPILDWEEEEEE